MRLFERLVPAILVLAALSGCGQAMSQADRQNLAEAELVDPERAYCEFTEEVWDFNWGCFRVIGITSLASETTSHHQPVSCWNMAIMFETTPFWYEQGVPVETRTWTEAGVPNFVQCVTYSDAGVTDLQGFDVGETKLEDVTHAAGELVCSISRKARPSSDAWDPCDSL